MKAHWVIGWGCLRLTLDDCDDTAELAWLSGAGVPIRHAANLGDRNGALPALQAPHSGVQVGTERASERWTEWGEIERWKIERGACLSAQRALSAVSLSLWGTRCRRIPQLALGAKPAKAVPESLHRPSHATPPPDLPPSTRNSRAVAVRSKAQAMLGYSRSLADAGARERRYPDSIPDS